MRQVLVFLLRGLNWRTDRSPAKSLRANVLVAIPAVAAWLVPASDDTKLAVGFGGLAVLLLATAPATLLRAGEDAGRR